MELIFGIFVVIAAIMLLLMVTTPTNRHARMIFDFAVLISLVLLGWLVFR